MEIPTNFSNFVSGYQPFTGDCLPLFANFWSSDLIPLCHFHVWNCQNQIQKVRNPLFYVCFNLVECWHKTYMKIQTHEIRNKNYRKTFFKKNSFMYLILSLFHKQFPYFEILSKANRRSVLLLNVNNLEGLFEILWSGNSLIYSFIVDFTFDNMCPMDLSTSKSYVLEGLSQCWHLRMKTPNFIPENFDSSFTLENVLHLLDQNTDWSMAITFKNTIWNEE